MIKYVQYAKGHIQGILLFQELITKQRYVPRQSLEPMICKFENVICGYAFNVGEGFMCQAPSDDEMPCNKRKSNEQ